jgi:hypothetical protein
MSSLIIDSSITGGPPIIEDDSIPGPSKSEGQSNTLANIIGAGTSIFQSVLAYKLAQNEVNRGVTPNVGYSPNGLVTTQSSVVQGKNGSIVSSAAPINAAFGGLSLNTVLIFGVGLIVLVLIISAVGRH